MSPQPIASASHLSSLEAITLFDQDLYRVVKKLLPSVEDNCRSRFRASESSGLFTVSNELFAIASHYAVKRLLFKCWTID